MNSCWFQKEIALQIWTYLDIELINYNLDIIIDSRLKDGCCKKIGGKDYFILHSNNNNNNNNDTNNNNKIR